MGKKVVYSMPFRKTNGSYIWKDALLHSQFNKCKSADQLYAHKEILSSQILICKMEVIFLAHSNCTMTKTITTKPMPGDTQKAWMKSSWPQCTGEAQPFISGGSVSDAEDERGYTWRDSSGRPLQRCGMD